MTEAEMILALADLSLDALWPERFGDQRAERAVRAWARALADLEPLAVSEALAYWVATERFPPFPADIREIVARQRGDIPEFTEVWLAVQKLASVVANRMNGQQGANPPGCGALHVAVYQAAGGYAHLDASPGTAQAHGRREYERQVKRISAERVRP